MSLNYQFEFLHQVYAYLSVLHENAQNLMLLLGATRKSILEGKTLLQRFVSRAEVVTF